MQNYTMGSLRFPAVLLVLLQTAMVPVAEELIPMSMFPDARDYSFYNCRKEMLEIVTKAGGLLQTELNHNEDFKNMWQSNTPCKKVIPGGTPEHITALMSYVNANSKFRSKFKRWVHTKSTGSASNRDAFPFKSLYFLLTDAMQLLKSKCTIVYSGTEEKYNAAIGDKVRFESFFPAKLDYSSATEDSTIGDTIGTVFNITSCSVINLDEVCISEEIDLLISPTEVFTVTNIKTIKNSNDHYKEITVVHSDIHSRSNCRDLESYKESSSSVLTSSSLNLMASLLVIYSAC
ncbi:ecto-ADP-ribosyltransferase 5 [Pseudorasbora parva]|uniref:ecto-ADP-ribosyltransferase 5 n=1 Tax=Pseudorasbora parva TaxID=51549 RepID=UPI00351F58FA